MTEAEMRRGRTRSVAEAAAETPVTEPA
jgi:hypothetical protein